MTHLCENCHGGGYTKNNIVPACKECNKKKHAKNPLDWLVTQVKGLVAYVRIMQYFGEAQ